MLPARAHGYASPTPLPLPASLHIPVYKPGPIPFHDGETLFYDASWLGVPAADARSADARNKHHPQWWTGEMWLNTSPVVDLVYRMRDFFARISTTFRCSPTTSTSCNTRRNGSINGA